MPNNNEEIQEITNHKPILYARDLEKSYRGRKVVNNVSIEVHSGHIICLLGPNGAGKTTTFHMIMGIVKPDKGKVFLNDQDITRCPLHLRARKGIGFLAQEPSIFRKLTVWQNIEAVLEFYDMTYVDRQEKIEELLDELQIKPLSQQKAHTLSGGERRRLEIARALAGSPAILMLDEPFSGIDPKSVAEIQEIIFDLRKKGIAILLTDHNVRETLQVADFAYIIAQGEILKHGSPGDLVKDEWVRKVYLGDKFQM